MVQVTLCYPASRVSVLRLIFVAPSAGGGVRVHIGEHSVRIKAEGRNYDSGNEYQP